MFKKILIANRGEIALRVIRACKELGIKTVCVYSTQDEESLPVKFADEAVCIGPAKSSASYLSMPAIISAAIITNTDAIHPGYGFLSENARFANLCKDHGIVFIGPSVSNISNMGDKSVAKEIMKKAGVPTIPGSNGVVKSSDEALGISKSIGFPVIIKASAGGGGKGMRIVKCNSGFDQIWNSLKNETKQAFGDDRLYIEKYLESPRHIEVQILADKFGNVKGLFERDCSIQRRHQKLIEEAPCIYLSDEVRENMIKCAIKAAKFMNYESVGTIEFLVDKDEKFYFMEMNTRIQVEHPVTEMITGLDLVKEQIKIACGSNIQDLAIKTLGHSIECRINAEDPFHNFLPSPGIIENLHFPGGFGVRIDSHIYSGYEIPSHYDSLLGKLIVWAPSRAEAILKMKNSLNEFVVTGIKTTIPLYIKIMSNKNYKLGLFNTDFIEKEMVDQG